jgi:hypothetical protein
MVYNPATDFFGLWRSSGATVSKMELPGLDLVISALARAGIINLSVSATAPVANQDTTVWLQTAVPSWTAEGSLFLWDKVTSAYLAATPALFMEFLEACAGRSGVSWWTAAGGPPLNTVGNDGDFSVRTDTPYGIYGPKAAGAWPADPLPGTADVVTSDALDNTFGSDVGQLIRRGPTEWEALAIGAENEVLRTAGTGLPEWVELAALFDTLFTDVQGSILFRGAGTWEPLPPGNAGEVLSTGGAGDDPAWASRTAEFESGTRMLFQQTAAPTGWTKSTDVNDYGMRIVSGDATVTAGTAFSTVFAQTATGLHELTIAEMPAHSHTEDEPGGPQGLQGGGTFPAGNIGAVASNTGSTGGSAGHSHTVNLTLAYVDVIIAAKD